MKNITSMKIRKRNVFFYNFTNFTPEICRKVEFENLKYIQFLWHAKGEKLGHFNY